MAFRSLEVCTGAGGQALGLEAAGFEHVALVEIDPHACQTLRDNRPNWNVIEGDLRDFHAVGFEGIDLLAAGVPCPPFSVAGKQLGKEDERDLFPEVIRLASELGPRAIFIENVPGLLETRFAAYRRDVRTQLEALGYCVAWAKLNACDFGVPQLRPRALMVALRPADAARFSWPEPMAQPVTVGKALGKEMGSRGWKGVKAWKTGANRVAPTLVGGSKKHGGPDLGPTRARQAWAQLGVDGRTLAEDPPDPDFEGMPRLTVRMAGIVQGFPAAWTFSGKKTNAYRQVGNAFPPPVAQAVGQVIRSALEGHVAGEDGGGIAFEEYFQEELAAATG